MSPLLLPLLLTHGAAQALEAQLSVGLEREMVDPFVVRAGPRLGAELRPVPWLGLAVTVAAYPADGPNDLRPLTPYVLERLRIAPDVSRMMATGFGAASFVPLRVEQGTFRSELAVVGGVGAVYTVDDGEMLMAEGDPSFEATAKELHPAALVGLRVGAGGPTMGVAARLERVSYRETVMEESVEKKNPIFVGVDLTCHLGGAR